LKKRKKEEVDTGVAELESVKEEVFVRFKIAESQASFSSRRNDQSEKGSPMSQESKTINCPNCGFEIDVNDLLYHELDAQLKKKYNDELAQEKRKYDKQQEVLKAERIAIDADKAKLEEQIEERVKTSLVEQTKGIEDKLKKQLEEEQSERLSELQKELKEKSEKVKELNQAKVAIEQLKREKDEQRSEIELESQKKINETLAIEREKIKKQEEEKANLAGSEKDILINQLKEKLKDASQKAEQGSMQLQGEAQELVIEEWLSLEFPLDTIDEIKKGVRGADCLQIVNTHNRQNCGSIYYESKRTKAFGGDWIEKFKGDIREKDANIGVLVTETMPNGMSQMGMVDGVWICSFSEFKGMSHVLRESVIQISHAVATQENRGDKVEMLYDFLTSNEFRLQIEAIVEGFTQMQTDLDSEKRAMASIWKKREKQIQKVLLNTTNMHGSVRGIAGNAVQSVPLLELAGGDDEG
jgi:hypothetical protein